MAKRTWWASLRGTLNSVWFLGLLHSKKFVINNCLFSMLNFQLLTIKESPFLKKEMVAEVLSSFSVCLLFNDLVSILHCLLMRHWVFKNYFILTANVIDSKCHWQLIQSSAQARLSMSCWQDNTYLAVNKRQTEKTAQNLSNHFLFQKTGLLNCQQLKIEHWKTNSCWQRIVYYVAALGITRYWGFHGD